jgi:magnesium-transporting ATPase (P-type)
MAAEILSLFWSGMSQFLFPILLIFLLTFAILGKTKILGENTQVLAWVSVAIAIIFVAVPFARNIVNQLVPFLAVMAVIFLIFMILYGFILQGDVKIEGGLKTFFLIVILASLAVAILAATGYWDNLVNFVNTQTGIVVNVFIVIVLAIVVFVVVRPAAK